MIHVGSVCSDGAGWGGVEVEVEVEVQFWGRSAL